LLHVILNLEAEILESKSFDAGQEEAWDLNRQEIEFLENYLAEIYEIAEPSIILGIQMNKCLKQMLHMSLLLCLEKKFKQKLLLT